MTTPQYPCDQCPTNQTYCGCCPRYRDCERWKTWFLWRWERFNAYAKAHGIEPTTKEEAE